MTGGNIFFGLVGRCCINAIARISSQAWKKSSGYRRRSLAKNAVYRFMTLTGPCLLWARRIDSQATEVAIRVDVLTA